MSNQSIAYAILGGGALIGLGLYMGLRSRSPAPDAPVITPAATVAAGAAPEQAVPASSIPRPSAASTRDAVASAIDKRRKALVDTCWRPLAAKAEEPSSVKLTWSGTIGPDGKSAAYGISEHREGLRPGLAECVQHELLTLEVPAPEKSTEISVEFELP
jgi:hypothetical protein